MKNPRNQQNDTKRQDVQNKPAPENKDNLDSRKEKEPGYKDNNNKQGRKSNSHGRGEDGQ
jgi:hypothetical protein